MLALLTLASKHKRALHHGARSKVLSTCNFSCIARKFQLAFELFAKCRKVYDKSSVTIEEIDTAWVNLIIITDYN